MQARNAHLQLLSALRLYNGGAFDPLPFFSLVSVAVRVALQGQSVSQILALSAR